MRSTKTTVSRGTEPRAITPAKAGAKRRRVTGTNEAPAGQGATRRKAARPAAKVVRPAAVRPAVKTARPAAKKARPTAKPARVTPLPTATKAPRTISPEEALQRAMHAPTARARASWARRGLAVAPRIDRTTQAMLLRQLYLTHYEERRFQKAVEVAEQMVALDVLPDVAHQDAARAKQAIGDIDGAVGHLRLAARVGPPRRRAFHWWTLGSLYYLAGRHDEAIGAMTRAARWGTTDKPLYLGHLAVVRCANGQEVPELPVLMERLAEVPAGQGYGRFVLGMMAYYGRRWADARRYLEAFVKRSLEGRPALAIALAGEIAIAQRTLAAIAKD